MIQDMSATLPSMPNFERVRKQFMKQLDLTRSTDDMTTDPVHHDFVTYMHRLGFDKDLIITTILSVDRELRENFEEGIKDCIEVEESQLELQQQTKVLHAILMMFKKLSVATLDSHNQMCRQAIHMSPLSQDSIAFQWPLIDMAQFEFGRKNVKIDMKNVKKSYLSILSCLFLFVVFNSLILFKMNARL